eukprot:2380390-Amphidinium_carterae.1
MYANGNGKSSKHFVLCWRRLWFTGTSSSSLCCFQCAFRFGDHFAARTHFTDLKSISVCLLKAAEAARKKGSHHCSKASTCPRRCRFASHGF